MRVGRPPRDLEAGSTLDLFLVAAVAAVLGIRFYLELTGYPQVGGATLHIAHVLWGGALMLIALVGVLSFLGRPARRWAALVGGLGFGTFVDEIGKFLTQDNDYFFQPAVSIIYVTFVLLYVGARSLHREQTATPRDFLANAVEDLHEMVRGDLDPRERARARASLDRSDPADPLVSPLRRVLEEAELVPVPSPGLPTRLRARLVAAYRRASAHPLFARTVVLFFLGRFVVQVGWALLLLLYLSTGRDPGLHWTWLRSSGDALSDLGVAGTGQLASSLLSGLFAGAGMWTLRRGRLPALRWFHRSVLVTLLLTQVFQFYLEQWSALIGLALHGLLLIALRFMIDQEREWAAA
jgi:hypothetical protein